MGLGFASSEPPGPPPPFATPEVPSGAPAAGSTTEIGKCMVPIKLGVFTVNKTADMTGVPEHEGQAMWVGGGACGCTAFPELCLPGPSVHSAGCLCFASSTPLKLLSHCGRLSKTLEARTIPSHGFEFFCIS